MSALYRISNKGFQNIKDFSNKINCKIKENSLMSCVTCQARDRGLCTQLRFKKVYESVCRPEYSASWVIQMP